jgi:hypothetical protein
MRVAALPARWSPKKIPSDAESHEADSDVARWCPPSGDQGRGYQHEPKPDRVVSAPSAKGGGRDSLIATDSFGDFAEVGRKMKQNREMLFVVKPRRLP